MGNSDGPTDEERPLNEFRGVPSDCDELSPMEVLRESDRVPLFLILEFLMEHSEQEFSSTEISEKLSIQKTDVETTLDSLHELDLVCYTESEWTIGDDDRLATFEGLLLSLSAIEVRDGDDEWDGWEDAARDPR